MRRPIHDMRSSMRLVALLALLLFACGAGVGAARAEVAAVPGLNGHVVNLTPMLTDAQVQALEAKLAAFEQARGRRIAVLLVENTGDESGAQYSNRVFDAWKLGDSDVLILVTENPYNERITPGRALGAVFTLPVIKRILDEDMSWPRVKLGDIDGELNGGVDRIIRLENGEAMPPPPKPEGSFKGSLLDAISPPPLAMGPWLWMIVGLPFVFAFASAFLGGKAALLRGCVTLPVIAGFVLLLGAGWLFALLLGAIAFYLAIRFDMGDLPEPSGSSVDQSNSGGSLGSVAWSLLRIAGSGVLSRGGGFGGGGGRFGGGGASGRW